MATAARVLLFLCLLLAMLEQTSVAALRERAGGQRARRTAPTCARAKRAVRPPRPARASRPLRRMKSAPRAPRPRAIRAPAVTTAETAAPPRTTGRLRRFTTWTGRVLSVRGALRFVERALGFLLPGKRATDLSATGLTVAGSRSIGAVRPALAAVSGVAGAALAAASAVELARARTNIERADAAHGIAWGLQSIGGIGGMWWNAPGWVEPTAFGLGLGGGAIQTAVGLYRLKSGLASRDRRTVVLGLLDTGAGASWIASTVTGNPIALAAFFGLTGARLIYTNAHRLTGLARRVGRRLCLAGKRCVLP